MTALPGINCLVGSRIHRHQGGRAMSGKQSEQSAFSSCFEMSASLLKAGGVQLKNSLDKEIDAIAIGIARSNCDSNTFEAVIVLKHRLNELLGKIDEQFNKFIKQGDDALREIILLRRELADGCKTFCVVTGDKEGEVKMDEYLTQMDADIFAAIADLDLDSNSDS